MAELTALGVEHKDLPKGVLDLLDLRCRRYLLRLVLAIPADSLPRRPKYINTGTMISLVVIRNLAETSQWYDLRQKDSRPHPPPSTHPYLREDRFFDSLGPGGVRTPRPEYYCHGPSDAKGGQDLEIDRQHIKQFAHYGYVYCMLLAQGLHFEDGGSQEVLISGGGDGALKIWALDTDNGGAIRELHVLDDSREEGEPVHSLAIDGAFLYAGRIDGEVNVWDLETRQLVRNLKVKTEDVFALSVGGGHLFCAGVNGIVEASISSAFPGAQL